MIHLIYDMDNGIAIADNKVKDYAADMVLVCATIEEVVEIRIGNENIVRSVIYAMKHRQIPPQNVTISYAHNPDAKIWIDQDYNLDGYYDFCTHYIDVLMDNI